MLQYMKSKRSWNACVMGPFIIMATVKTPTDGPMDEDKNTFYGNGAPKHTEACP